MDVSISTELATNKTVESTHSTKLPDAAKAGEVYLPRAGVSRTFESFDNVLATKLRQLEGANGTSPEQRSQDAKELFARVSHDVVPQVVDVIAEMKRLGISRDLLLPPELGLVAYGLRADMLGSLQRRDQPFIKDEQYKRDPLNPLYEITIAEDGTATITPEKPHETDAERMKEFVKPDKVDEIIASGESILNEKLETQELRDKLTNLYATLKELGTNPNLASDPKLRTWVERQAISRGILLSEGELKPEKISLEGATVVKNLSKEANQASNEVLLLKTPDGRLVVAKRGPSHLLQAEVLENKAMAAMGLPVPETYVDTIPDGSNFSLDGQPVLEDGEHVLVIGFLDGHFEEQEAHKLTERYHTNKVLQGGLIADLWMGQYNRRAHNIMMKDGKIDFIDHGGAVFCRATGGFKEFTGIVNTTHVWDIVRTIPDGNPNTDEPVNEAYSKIFTVEGGPDGKVILKDPYFLESQVRRLQRFDRDQITAMVDAAGYTDGEESIAQMREWIAGEDIEGRIAKIIAKRDSGEELTMKDERDLRWTEGAKRTMEAAIAAGGMRTYMIDTLERRRDEIVRFFEPLLKEATRRPEKRKVKELINDDDAFSWEKALPQLQRAKDLGKTIVITNGHFVMLQPGHAFSLEQAREEGISSRRDKKDASVVLLAIVNADHQTELKDPVKAAAQTAHERAIMVYKNEDTDVVAISEAPQGDTSLITDFQKLADADVIGPATIYVKGGDYAEDDPPEATLIKEHGGVFIVVDRVGGFSTTSQVDSMLEKARELGRR